MAHICNRGGYYSLEESYRDEQGRPRKRRLEYYGRNKPFNIFTDVDWEYTLRGDGAAFDEQSLPVSSAPAPAHKPPDEPVAEPSPAEPSQTPDQPSEQAPDAPDGTDGPA